MSVLNLRRSPREPLSRRRFRPGVEAMEARVALSLGPEFAITTANNNGDADNASSANGSSVAVWIRSGVTGPTATSGTPIQYRVYNAQGQPTGLLRTFESTRLNSQPSVGMDAAGNFVIAWTRTGTNGDRNVLAARFNAAGNQVGQIINVATQTTRAEYEPTVAVAANGSFVVAYTVQNSPTDNDVFARTYNTAGLPVRTVAVASTAFNEHAPSAAGAPDGRFAVAYQRDGLGTQPDVFLVRYTAAADRSGLVAIADTTRFEATPDVDMDNNANAVVTWYEISPSNVIGVYARRVTQAGSAGPRLTIREASTPSSFPSVALNRTNGSFVVAYELGFYSVNPEVLVTEVTANNVLRPTVNAGVNRFGTALSINGSNRYFLTYTARSTRPNQTDIRGRFGSLA